MYEKRQHCWISGFYEEAVLNWCHKEFNQNNPQALFVQADVLLSQAERGKETATAVYLMERAAKMEYVPAVLAMGQMFEFGWSVHRDEKTAVKWYQKAAALGSGEASAFLKELRRKRRRRVWLAGTVCLTVAGIGLLRFLLPADGIRVHRDTALLSCQTHAEFTQALNELVSRYDTDQMLSGQEKTGRLLLKYEGAGIDLSRFPAACVIVDAEQYCVIQFSTPEEAEEQLAALRQIPGVLFVSQDAYSVSTEGTSPSDAFHSSGLPYVSAYNGVTYYSWGVEFMGLDRLAAWLMTRQTTPVTVAVLDTGVEPCKENQHRILEGADMVMPSRGNGWHDTDGHGTHVAGTIMDCTWGLDVSILPVQVFSRKGYASESSVVQGLRYAIDSNVDLINLSLGNDLDAPVSGDTCDSAKDYYIQQAIENGIVVVAAAGNGDDDGNPVSTNMECPAHMDACIVVGACDSNGWIAPFSNYGASVDVCAPGVDVISYCLGGTFACKSGTSMAAPHITALAAMLRLYMPDKTPGQIEKYIKEYCFQGGDSAYYGKGLAWAGWFAGD